MDKEYLSWLPEIIRIANKASLAILEFYQNKTYQVRSKNDQSPITEADLKAHEIIVQGLSQMTPELPIISEEGSAIPYASRVHWSRYWLVDPLDGTREFIEGTGEFTVNIALVENHIPVLGVVIAPWLQQTYWAVRGGAAFFQDKDMLEPKKIQVHTKLEFPIKVALSHHHQQEKDELQKILNPLGAVEFYYYGSALKICLVARGIVDLYPRLGRTGEWDTAAGQCILEAAGGQLVDLQGRPLRYNTQATLFNPAFLASSCADLLTLVVDKSNPV